MHINSAPGRTLDGLSISEKRQLLARIARDLIVSGEVPWPDNTPVTDENGNEIGHVLIVDTSSMEPFPPLSPEYEAEIDRRCREPDDSIPIEEFLASLKTQ